jgi:hypothetical protein
VGTHTSEGDAGIRNVHSSRSQIPDGSKPVGYLVRRVRFSQAVRPFPTGVPHPSGVLDKDRGRPSTLPVRDSFGG